MATDMFWKMVFGDMDKNAKTCLKEAMQVGKLTKDLKSRADALEGGGFIGQTAKAWFNEVNQEIVPRLEKLEKALTESAETIQWLSEQTDAADNQYASLFQKLFR